MSLLVFSPGAALSISTKDGTLVASSRHHIFPKKLMKWSLPFACLLPLAIFLVQSTSQWHGMGQDMPSGGCLLLPPFNGTAWGAKHACTDAAKAHTHTVYWPKARFAIDNSMHLVSSQSTHIKTSIPAQITTSQSCRQFRCHIAHQNNHCLNCLQMMTSHPLRNVCGTCCCRSCRQETQSARKGPSPGPYK